MKIEDLKKVSELIEQRQDHVLAFNAALKAPDKITFRVGVSGWAYQSAAHASLVIMQDAAEHCLETFRTALKEELLAGLREVEKKLENLGVDADERGEDE